MGNGTLTLESILGKDTDEDGLRDGLEDANGNGIVDENETDPLSLDTDGDALSDGDEVLIIGTNPLASDTDNDGLSDGLNLALSMTSTPRTTTNPTVQTPTATV